MQRGDGGSSDLDWDTAIRSDPVNAGIPATRSKEDGAVVTPVAAESFERIAEDLGLSTCRIDNLELSLQLVKEADLPAVRRPEGILGAFGAGQRLRVLLIERPDPKHYFPLSGLAEQCDLRAIRRNAHVGGQPGLGGNSETDRPPLRDRLAEVDPRYG